MNPISPPTYDFHPQTELSNERKEEQNVCLPKFVPYPSPSSILASENSAFSVVSRANNPFSTTNSFTTSYNTVTANPTNTSSITSISNLTNISNITSTANSFQTNTKKLTYKAKRVFKVF